MDISASTRTPLPLAPDGQLGFTQKLTRWAALFAGAVVFAPVGLNYLAFFLLIAAMLVQGGLQARARRFMSHPLCWPILIFVAWTLVVLALRPVYPETPSNLVHGVRIAGTLVLTLSLALDEVRAALRGFLGAAAVALAIVVLNWAVGLPEIELWKSLVRVPEGNKFVSNAVLFAFLACAALVIAVNQRGWRRWTSLCLAAVLLASSIWLLPNRASLVALLMSLLVAGLHQWRERKGRLALLLAAVLALLVGLAQIPKVQDLFALGISELQAAQAGAVSEGSWNVRFHMYAQTAGMMQESPVLGWGIGSWNEQWRQRAPALLHGYNMPHNDFLWMGAQAGFPGALSLAAVCLTALWAGWRRRDVVGRLALVAATTVTVATLFNSAMRDAKIGLSLLFVLGILLCLAHQESEG